jgi:CDP-diacylglycerol---glycerol-3-phosphate 3-phosphatidyltransferase
MLRVNILLRKGIVGVGFMKIAMLLTLFRLFATPFFVVIYLFYEALHIPLLALPFILLSILIFMELSDAFDGFFARRLNQVTVLGKILDPMTDSFSRISMLLAFTQGIVKLPMILVLVFVFRDGMISTLRILCALKGVALAARPSGKIKAILQAITIFCILILACFHLSGYISLDVMRAGSFYVTLASAAFTLISGFEYLWVYRGYIKEAGLVKKSA